MLFVQTGATSKPAVSRNPPKEMVGNRKRNDGSWRERREWVGRDGKGKREMEKGRAE